jgi:hypothetical protein
MREQAAARRAETKTEIYFINLRPPRVLRHFRKIPLPTPRRIAGATGSGRIDRAYLQK